MKKAFIGLLVIAVILITSCESGLSTQNTDGENRYPDYKSDRQEYKIFYGEWEITEFIGYGPSGINTEDEDKTSYIGLRLKYDVDRFQSGDSVVSEPYYTYHIVPIYKEEQKHAARAITIQDLGLTCEYFTYVNVRQYDSDYDRFGYSMIAGSSFYIKDISTLIIQIDTKFYVAERIGDANHVVYEVL